HLLRYLKRFRILKDTYRNRTKRFGLRLNLLAAIANLHL
ncbi:MAG TPA: IS5/IS1182 family transposase, partial [Abditibacterium sp.]